MDNYTLSSIKDNGTTSDITRLSGDLSWRDSLDTLGMELSVRVARNLGDRYMRRFDIVEVGDKIILKNNNDEIFRGIIVDLNTEKHQKVITAFDYAFYLNQSKTIIQFNKKKADDCVKKLCSQFNIPIGNIESIGTQINKIYKNETISDIIKDVLKQATNSTGIKYRLEMRAGKLYIERYTNLYITPRFKPASNLAAFNPTTRIGSISKGESIADMRNSILITSSDEKSSRVVASVRDSTNIAKYGLLQEVETVDEKDIAQAKNIANNKLKELNKINEDISIKLLGDDKVRSGRIIGLNNNVFGLLGNYLVKECAHNYQNKIHTMDLTLEKVM